ncbi:hypothetical protein Dimus_033909 [Dionaea muscipula]
MMSTSNGSNVERKEYQGVFKPTKLTLATLANMEARGKGFSFARAQSGAKSYIYDNSAPEYSWLLPGWLAEERIVSSGRLYKYYYDPSGGQYKAKYEVLDMWEKFGVIFLDD